MDNQESEQKLKSMEKDVQQEGCDRTGRRIIQILAYLGGSAGILIAVLQLSASLVGPSPSQISAGGSEMDLARGALFLLLGLTGITGAILSTKKRNIAGWLLLCSGLLGFPAAYFAWSSQGGFLGWVLWIPPGVLLTAAGLLALITPERLRSSLVGQDSNPEDAGSIGQALFVGSVLAGIGLLTVILLFSGILFIEAEDALKGDTARDEEDFSEADMAASMGMWDTALQSYDKILSRNQSNTLAWQKRADALQQLGEYDEAVESYEKALETNPGNEILQEQLEEARRAASAPAHLRTMKNDTNAMGN